MPDRVLPDMLRIFDQVAEQEQTATAVQAPAPAGFMPHLQGPATPAAPAPTVKPGMMDEMAALAAKLGAPESAPINPEDFGLPPRHLWPEMGQIGVGESFERQGVREGVVERLPFIGVGFSAYRLWNVHQAAKALQGIAEGGYNIGELWRRYKAHPALERDPIVQETAEALKVAMPFYYETEMAQERGLTIPAEATQLLADMLPFVVEFVATGGVASGARAAVKGGVQAAAKKVIGGTAARLVAGAAGAATSAAVRTVLSPGRVLQSLVSRRIPSGFGITETGDLEITEPTEGAATSFAKAFGDVFIEMLSEESGAALGAAAKGAGKFALSPFARIPGATGTSAKLLGGIRDAWMASTGRTSRQFAHRAMSRLGFNGILEEMGEERLGSALRAVLNIEDFGAEDPKSMLSRLVASVPSGEQLLVEALAFSVPGAARAGLGVALDARGAKARNADPNHIAAIALLVARDSDDPTLQRYGEKVLGQVVAGEKVERGLADKVLAEGDAILDAAEQQQATIVPAEAPAQSRIERLTGMARELAADENLPAEQRSQFGNYADKLSVDRSINPRVAQAATPAPVAQGEVQGQGRELSVPPTEQVAEPAPAAASQITIEMPREEAPAPTAEEAPVRIDRLGDKDFEASVRVSESRGAERPDMVGISIQDAPDGRYVVRVGDEAEGADLHSLIASQLSEMTDAERIQTLKVLEPEVGVEGVREIVRSFASLAPRLARRSRVLPMWGVNPTLPGSGAPTYSGGLHTEQAEEMLRPLYEKYRKVLPLGVMRKLLGDWTSWKQVNRSGVSPEVLKDWIRRHKPSPIKAAYLGAVSQQMTEKQLRNYIDALKEKMDAPSAAVLAKAYRSALGARTTGQVTGVLEAVNLAVEKHNRAVAEKNLKNLIADIKDQGLLPEYREKLDALLADVAEKKPKTASVEWAFGVLAAAEREGRYVGPLQSDIESARDVLQRHAKRGIGELSRQEIDDLAKALATVANMDRLKRELLTTQKGRTFAGILSEVQAEVGARLGNKYSAKAGQRNVRKAMSKLLDLVTLSQLSHETMVHILGGPNSVLYDMLMRRLREGENETGNVWMRTMDRFKAALAAEDITMADAEKWSDAVSGKLGTAEEVRVKLDSGKTAVLSVAEAMELLLHSWDADTLEQLRTSKGIRMGEASDISYEVSGRDLELFEAQMQEEHPQAYRLAKQMGEILNGELRYELNKAWRKHHFYEVAAKTDYWPRRRVNSDEDKDDPNEMMVNWRKHFLDDMGIFKERRGSKEAVIIRDAFSTFLRHVNRTSTYIGKAMPHADAVRLLRSPEFQATVRGNIKYGIEWLSRMEKAVGDWAGTETQEREAYQGLVKKFIRGAHLGVLGLKPPIIFYQVVSATSALNEMGAKYLVAEVNKDSASTIRDEMHRYASTLWMRVTGSGHNIVSPGAGDSGINEMFGAKEGLLTRVGLGPIHWGDNQVMYRIWQAAKAEGAEKGLSGDELMKYVGVRAREVVDRTQPTYDPLTVSGLQNAARKNPLLALLLLYRSQSNKNVNMAVRAISDWLHGGDKRLGVMLAKVTLPILGNAIGVTVISVLYKMLKGEVMSRVFGAPDDEDRGKRAVTELTWGTAERTLTQWMLAGDVLNLLALGARTGAQGGPLVTVPERSNLLTSAGNDAVATLYYVSRALAQSEERYKSGPRKYDSKSEQAWINAAERAARLASVTFGLPIQEVTSIGAKALREAE